MQKPKVFLSHSKQDVNFIRNLAQELQKCQIETWLDEIDIQHGESWLQSIFDEGIGKCDLIFVYISSASITSSMVQKEIDASLISQLRVGNIKLLPYCENADLRQSLRLDLQSLQMPILNPRNVKAVLPQIVSNIWLHYVNQVITNISKEKELQIENLRLTIESDKNRTSQLSANDEEFEIIYTKLQAPVTISYSYKISRESPSITKTYNSTLLSIFNIVYYGSYGKIEERTIESIVQSFITNSLISIPNMTSTSSEEIGISINCLRKLLLFGFVNRNFNPNTKESVGNDIISRSLLAFHQYEVYTISEKFDRFSLWLELNEKKIGARFEEQKSSGT